MKKFKRTKYPKLKKRLPIVLITLLILFFGIFFWIKVNADSNFAVVSGYAWEDANGDSKIDEGEKRYSNIEVLLCDENGNKIADTRTKENGYYEFDINLEGKDKYRIKFKYDGLQYKGEKIVKQSRSYELGEFVKEVNIVWNFPKSSQEKVPRFLARFRTI